MLEVAASADLAGARELGASSLGPAGLHGASLTAGTETDTLGEAATSAGLLAGSEVEHALGTGVEVGLDAVLLGVGGVVHLGHLDVTVALGRASLLDLKEQEDLGADSDLGLAVGLLGGASYSRQGGGGRDGTVLLGEGSNGGLASRGGRSEGRGRGGLLAAPLEASHTVLVGAASVLGGRGLGGGASHEVSVQVVLGATVALGLHALTGRELALGGIAHGVTQLVVNGIDGLGLGLLLLLDLGGVGLVVLGLL